MTTEAQQAAWEDLRARQVAYYALAAEGKVGLTEFLEMKKAQRLLEDLLDDSGPDHFGRRPPSAEPRIDLDPRFTRLVEMVRSAHALLHSVVTIGSFQLVSNDDPVDHDATCTLIMDAQTLLKRTLAEAQK